MRNKSTPSLALLDDVIASSGFPVRVETLEQAWRQAKEAPATASFQDRARRLLEGNASKTSDEVTILVTLRAKPARAAELEQAAIEFVEATRQLEGAIGSTLYRSSSDPQTLILFERFIGQRAFSRHMSSAYFRRFQVAQGPLLAAPVEAVFLKPIQREESR